MWHAADSMASELGSHFSNKAQEGNMRHIKTICDSDSYLIHHHGGLQVNTCTVLQQLLRYDWKANTCSSEGKRPVRWPYAQSGCWNNTEAN